MPRRARAGAARDGRFPPVSHLHHPDRHKRKHYLGNSTATHIVGVFYINVGPDAIYCSCATLRRDTNQISTTIRWALTAY